MKIQEMSDNEVDVVSGAGEMRLSTFQRLMIGAAPFGLGGAALGIYDTVALGWNSAHGRALNADS